MGSQTEGQKPVGDSPTEIQPKKKRLNRLQVLVLAILAAKARGREQYRKADEKLERLKALVEFGAPIPMPSGKPYAVYDDFEGEKYAKKMVIIDRYALRQVKDAKAASDAGCRMQDPG